MKKISDKLNRENREYSKKRKIFLEEHPMCQAKLHQCTLKSTEVHHKKGRGKYLLDEATWLSVCRKCHDYIENNPEDALELGFTITRITDHDL